MLMLTIFINIFIIILLLCIIFDKLNRHRKEDFSQGYGTSFSQYYDPNPPCDTDSNCFVGFPSRGTTYSNMCEPAIPQIDGLNVGSTCDSTDRLLREPVQLDRPCYRVY